MRTKGSEGGLYLRGVAVVTKGGIGNAVESCESRMVW